VAKLRERFDRLGTALARLGTPWNASDMLIEAHVIRRGTAERPMSTHTYSSYLEIDKLLSAQRSMTDW
jgi:hypothetical protein